MLTNPDVILNKALRDNRAVLCCSTGGQQAVGDGRLIALSMKTGAVISAVSPDSISDVSVSPHVLRLMFSSPFLSSLLISSSLC